MSYIVEIIEILLLICNWIVYRDVRDLLDKCRNSLYANEITNRAIYNLKKEEYDES